MRRLILSATLIVFALTGCGGAARQTPHQQVTGVLHAYLTAQVSGDGLTACGLLTPAAQQELTGVVMRASNGLITKRPSCQEAVRLASVGAPRKLLDALRTAQVERVSVQGDQASAYIVDGGQFSPQKVSLQRAEGAWKIAGVPGLAG